MEWRKLDQAKRDEAAAAVAAANPRWSDWHVKFMIERMPTRAEDSRWVFPTGSPLRDRAEQLFIAQLHAWMVEVNLMEPDAAYQLPQDFVSPYAEMNAPRIRSQRGVREPRDTTATPRVAGAVKSGSKKLRVKQMLEGGHITAAQIVADLGVSEAAAKALIGDVKRMGVAVETTGRGAEQTWWIPAS